MDCAIASKPFLFLLPIATTNPEPQAMRVPETDYEDCAPQCQYRIDCRLSTEEVVWQPRPLSIGNRKSSIDNRQFPPFAVESSHRVLSAGSAEFVQFKLCGSYFDKRQLVC
jgi:hypothetical protein